MKKTAFNFIIAFVFFPSIAWAASYDCKQTTHLAEVTVCENFDLSVDDRVVSSLFHLEKRGAYFEVVKKSQKVWLKRRDQCAGDLSCLKMSYKNRIAELSSMAAKQGIKFFIGPATPWQIDSAEMLTSLRLVHGILENIDRHSLLPKLSGNDVEYFSNFWPNLIRYPGDETVDWREARTPLDKNPLSENKTTNEQISFGPGVAVDYEGISRCLKDTLFSKFEWRGVSFSSSAAIISNRCISFYFPSEWQQLRAGDLYFPLVSSELNHIQLQQNNKLLDSQSCKSLTALLKLDAKRLCEGSAYRAGIEYYRTLNLSLAKSPYKFPIWLQKISSVSGCPECLELNLSRDLLQLARDRIVQLDKKPECFFDDDGIYTCRDVFGESRLKACISGSHVYQVVQTADGAYTLRFWMNATQYLDNKKPKTTRGVLLSQGRLECSSQYFSFPNWAVKLGDVNECSTDEYPRALNNIAYIQCDRSTPYCSSNTGPMLCVGVD
jgi:uncharacterized protein